MRRAWFSITVLKFSGISLTQFELVQSKVKIECLLHTGCAMKGLAQAVIKVTPLILRSCAMKGLAQAVIKVTPLILRIGVLQGKTKRLSREDRHVHGNGNCCTMYKLDYKNIYNSFTVLINNLFTI